MAQPVRPFLGETAEHRVQSRRRQLIEKSFELIAEDNWRNTSIAQLCRDVNLNKRYFYESFQDLLQVEDAVVEGLTSELLQLGWKSVAEAQEKAFSTEEMARFVLKACIHWLVSDPRRAKVLFSKASDNARAKLHRDNVIAQLAKALSEFAVVYHQPKQPGIITTDKHHTLARLGSALLIGGTIESILQWTEGKIALSIDEFADHIARFWVAIGDSAVSAALQDLPPAEPA